MPGQIDKEKAANIAELTVHLAPVREYFTPDEVAEQLRLQRIAIAARLRSAQT